MTGILNHTTNTKQTSHNTMLTRRSSHIYADRFRKVSGLLFLLLAFVLVVPGASCCLALLTLSACMRDRFRKVSEQIFFCWLLFWLLPGFFLLPISACAVLQDGFRKVSEKVWRFPASFSYCASIFFLEII